MCQVEWIIKILDLVQNSKYRILELVRKDTRTTELYLRIPENERLVASKEYFEMYGSLIDEEEISL